MLIRAPLIVSAASVALVAVGCCRPAAGPDRFHSNVIAVEGIGEFEAKPDIARITLGCESQSASAAEAASATAAKISAVITAVEQTGVPAKDIQTSQVSIYSEYTPPTPPPAPLAAPAGPGKGVATAVAAPAAPQLVYRATNSVSVTMRQIDRAGAVIGAAFATGANQAGGIQFDIENHQPLVDQARAKAVADASHRAQELARLSNVKLGRVLGVMEGAAEEPGPRPYALKAASFAADSSVAPVESGQIKVTYAVRVTYALGE